MFRKIRLVIGLAALTFIAAVMGVSYMFGDGDVHVVLPEGRTVSVLVDGQPATPSHTTHRHQRFSLKQGKHTFEFKDADSGQSTTAEVSLNNGFAKFVVPVDSTQCFARLDVTKSMYSDKRTSQNRPAPQIVERIAQTEPFKLDSSTYLDDSEAPSKIKSSQKVYLLLDVPCDTMRQGDAQVLSELGF